MYKHDNNRETENMKKRFGYIQSYMSDTGLSQHEWDVQFHKPENCSGAKRPTGCTICEHESANCKLKRCTLCAVIQGTQLDPNRKNWRFPKN